MRKGRPSKHYTTTGGETLVGLYRRTDGRWIVKATGECFTQADERLAVAKYRKIMEKNNAVELPGAVVAKTLWAALGKSLARVGGATTVEVDTDGMWAYMRELLITQPTYFAQRIGIPEIANFADQPRLARSPSLEELTNSYCENAGIGDCTARHARLYMKRFRRMTGFVTLRDITTDKLLEYRKAIKAKYSSEWTIKQNFSRVKGVIAFGLKEGQNTDEIGRALAKLKVLHCKEGQKNKPSPIAPDQFRKLLAGAGPEVRAVLLLSLNACLYLSECLSIKWEEITDGTYSGRRNKTDILRAATLWPETLDALKHIPRRGQSPYIFTSNFGTAFMSTDGYRKKFNRLCDAVGVDVEFNTLRDGAYTAACGRKVAFAACQLFAGHALPGQADHYVERTPWAVKDACDAVYDHYGPFPASKSVIARGRPKKANQHRFTKLIPPALAA